jgi:hypothetical protein
MRRRCFSFTVGAITAAIGIGSPSACGIAITSSRPICAAMATAPGRWGSYTEINYIYDIAQLVHQETMAPVTIIAHSLGGSSGLLYSGSFPETVQKLVSIEGMGPSSKMMEQFTPRRSRSACAAVSRCVAIIPGACQIRDAR